MLYLFNFEIVEKKNRPKRVVKPKTVDYTLDSTNDNKSIHTFRQCGKSL